jgi:hypothetical protein
VKLLAPCVDVCSLCVVGLISHNYTYREMSRLYLTAMIKVYHITDTHARRSCTFSISIAFNDRYFISLSAMSGVGGCRGLCLTMPASACA